MIAPLILPAFGIQSEIAVAAVPDDERVWVPQAEGVCFSPLSRSQAGNVSSTLRPAAGDEAACAPERLQ